MYKHDYFIVTHQGFVHVLLATWDAEIMRIVVQSQPGQIVCETLYCKNNNKNS
jgi:hypothetical protein